MEVLASDSLSFKPNELKQFERIRKQMTKRFENGGARYCVVVDHVVGRHQYDMIVIKNDAVVSLDLKGYSRRVVGSENGSWHVEKPDGRSVEIGQRRNPFLQARDQRFQLISFLNRVLPSIAHRFKKNSIRNVSSVVCFEGKSSMDIDQIDHRASPWFHVTNESNLLDYLEITASNEFFLKDVEIDALLKVMNLRKLEPREGSGRISLPEVPSPTKEYKPNIVYDNILKVGNRYPGSYVGDVFGFDSRGVLFRKLGTVKMSIYGVGDDLWVVFKRFKPDGGRFRVNSYGHVLTKVSERGFFRTIYLGNIKDYPLTFWGVGKKRN